MEQQLKVAFFGIKPASMEYNPSTAMLEHFPCIGIRRFTMGVEMALDIIRNSNKGNLSNNEVPGLPLSEDEIEVMLGGRTFPVLSQREVARILKDIDLFIISGAIHQSYAVQFLIRIDPSVVLNNCTIVLRMPFTQEEASGRTLNEVSAILRDMGMNENGEAIRMRKTRKISPKILPNNRSIFLIGLEEYGGCPPEKSIPLLQAHLLDDNESIVEQLVQPVKETVSAGKSFFNLGRTFTGWISRLVKKN